MSIIQVLQNRSDSSHCWENNRIWCYE